ncbi:hypothetical protein ACIF80_37400 [Streptomyces sp. NPDC085927]|uniref:hypothetical protein n=1 Tax=Streptomyces sp. NPDC085927 TaxID=3365738 RepID=UPI0037CFAE2A
MTEADLTEALPDGGELPGFVAVPQDLALLEAEDVVTADTAACRPIADMMSVHPRHPRNAMVWATMKPQGAPADATPGSLTLTSHEDKAARAWMAELKQALSNCTEFTATSKRGWTHRFSVRPLPQVKAGDDSVNYVLTNALAPDGKGNVMTVVRTGGAFATYLMDQDAGKPVPVAVANQQHKKLQGAVNS